MAARGVALSEPPGLTRAPVAPRIFSTEPHRNLGQPGISRELTAVPDDLLIATALQLGMPRWSAEQCRYHPFARFNLLRTYMDVLDAREGDGQAKERIDYIRHCFVEMRKIELVSERPSHTIGLWER